MEIGEGILFVQDFTLDKSHDTYERQVYTFSMVMQDVGGLFNALYFAGLILYSILRDSLVFTDLISKSFNQQSSKKNDALRKKKNIDKITESINCNEEHDHSMSFQEVYFQIKDKIKEQYYSSITESIKQLLFDNTLKPQGA